MKKIKLTFGRITFMLLIIFLSFSFISCNNDDDTSVEQEDNYELPIIEDPTSIDGYPIIKKQVPYVKLSVTNDVSKLLYDSNTKDVNLASLKDTVLVYIEGGPVHLPNYAGSLELLDNIVKEYVSKNYSFVGVRQYHEYNPTVFGSGTTFTDQIAEYSNNESLNMIEKTVNKLKSSNHVVYLLGHSNGSFMLQNYIVNNKTSPDGYLIAGTRIKKVQAFFDYYLKGEDILFINGTDITLKSFAADEFPYFNVLTKLQLNHFKNYTSLLLNNSSQFSKMYYALGGQDVNLGRIEQDEFDFLNNNKINYTYNAENDHSLPILDVLIYGMDYLRKK